MKKNLVCVGIVLIFGSLLFASSITAQDSVSVVSYNLNKDWLKMIEGVPWFTPQQKERARYMWGNRTSFTTHAKLWYSDTVSYYCDIPDEEEIRFGYTQDPFLIRRNFSTMTTYDVIKWLGKTQVIEDTLIMPQWKILNDVREIAGHICMSAAITDTVKGQYIVAWFALDIASPAGPERLCGLPGLILGVEINNGALEIMAQSVTKEPLTTQLDIPHRFNGKKIKGKHITETGYQLMVQKYMDEKRETMDYPFWGIRY
ncbi:MAG TPA: GLPGLI family protein [Bacteroidales bacterium]|nr:GLPGLI family protein [Bacteroidales bacterium]HRZ49857.1 GLPGLI family protein [Bacteroidales bacterium]